MTFAAIEKGTDNNYSLKPLKQKQFVDGLSYLLQEIYGIENKNMERSKVPFFHILTKDTKKGNQNQVILI